MSVLLVGLPSRCISAGTAYLWPKMPEKPAYPPGSSGSRSGDTLDTDAAAAQTGLFFAQWTAIPSKSATAWSRVT